MSLVPRRFLFIVLLTGITTVVVLAFNLLKKPKERQVLGLFSQKEGSACLAIKLYKNPSWEELTILERETISSGDALYLVALPRASNDSYDRARFRIKEHTTYTSWQETSEKTPKGEFYISYTVPSNTDSLVIEVELHRKSDGVWE